MEGSSTDAPDLLYARVAELLAGRRRLGVAFSGGVDSSVLVACAARALGGEAVVAILGVSPSLAVTERLDAHHVAESVGVRVVEIDTHEGDKAAYVTNGPDRCFHCKDELFTRIDDELVDTLALDAIAYGENADDARRPDRPGAAAATQHHVLRPLAEAGLTKDDVRALARWLGLPNADKPAAPCLASRIPHGEPVTSAKLAQVQAAETTMRRCGFPDGRVRHHGDVARIELPTSDIARAADPEVAARLVEGIRGAGFRFVALDLVGIQSGAFTLPLVEVTGG